MGSSHPIGRSKGGTIRVGSTDIRDYQRESYRCTVPFVWCELYFTAEASDRRVHRPFWVLYAKREKLRESRAIDLPSYASGSFSRKVCRTNPYDVPTSHESFTDKPQLVEMNSKCRPRNQLHYHPSYVIYHYRTHAEATPISTESTSESKETCNERNIPARNFTSCAMRSVASLGQGINHSHSR